MKAQDIINYAEQNKIDIEIYGPCTSILYIDGKVYEGTQSYFYEIGIEFKKNVYYWWKSIPLNINDFDEVHFNHRYNRVNGATIKGFRTGYKAELIINPN